MFSRSHSQQVAGWDSNPMSWLPSLCFIVIKVPTIFLTSLGGAYMKNCPFSIIRMGVAHSWIWNPGWLCFCLLLKLWATSSAIEFFLILKKKNPLSWWLVLLGVEFLTTPFHSSLSRHVSLCVVWGCGQRGMKVPAVHPKDSSHHSGSTQVVG